MSYFQATFSFILEKIDNLKKKFLLKSSSSNQGPLYLL